MQVGEVASLAGLNPKTIRYYEAIGLLPPPARITELTQLQTELTTLRAHWAERAAADPDTACVCPIGWKV